MGGKNISYMLHNRFYHSLLHLKLCWSENSKILCSVASDRVIYGWDVDASMAIFQSKSFKSETFRIRLQSE